MPADDIASGVAGAMGISEDELPAPGRSRGGVFTFQGFGQIDGGEEVEELADVFFFDSGRVSGAVEADEAFAPGDIGLFGAIAELATPAGDAHLVDEFRRTRHREEGDEILASFRIFISWTDRADPHNPGPLQPGQLQVA